MQQVASSVWDTLVDVPLSRVLESLDISDKLLLQVSIKNNRLELPWFLGLCLSPSEAPPMLLINRDQIAFLVHAVNNGLFNELFDDRGVSAVSHNVDL